MRRPVLIATFLFAAACIAAATACSSGGPGTGGAGTTSASSTTSATSASSTTSASSANGTGGSGGAAECTPGEMRPCYTGPPGTEGVGTCKGGSEACGDHGSWSGVCAGEVTPEPEDCDTMADEDCDGMAPPCEPIPYTWSRAWGSLSDDEGTSVAVDPEGNVILGGYMNGTIDFGCGPISASGLDNALLVKLSPSGDCLWSKRFGSFAYVAGVASDAAGNVLITGSFATPLDLGGGPLQANGLSDVFVAKLGPDGSYQWALGAGDALDQTASGIAVSASGDVLVTGYFQGTMSFGGPPLVSAGGTDVYVARLSASGAHVWSERFGDAENQLGRAVTTDASGDVILAGGFAGGIDFGGGVMTSAGIDDVFVAKLGPSGDFLWSKAFGDAADQGAVAVGTDAAGDVLVTGYFDGSIDFGGATLVSQGSADVFLAKLDPSGAHLWSRSGGGPSSQSALSLAVDQAGEVAIAGLLNGSADLGGGTLVSAGGGDVFVAKYGASGACLWTARYGDVTTQTAQGVAMDAAGFVVVAGVTSGPLDLGGGLLGYVGGEDVFVAKLGP